MLSGKPVIMHTIERIEQIEEISEIIIVSLSGYKDYILDYISKYNLKKTYKIVDGGKTRQESVFNGLKTAKYDTIILHEASRPFITVEDYIKLIHHEAKNVTYALPLSFTVLTQKNNKINGLLKREELVNIQLPQKFERETLYKAHIKAINDKLCFTDDTSLLYYYENVDIQILEGMDYNIKLTTSVDLIIAEEIYNEYMVVK